MKPPPFEVADIIRAHGNSFVEKSRVWLTWLHLRVLFAIEHCRTAAMGGHLDRCGQCGHLVQLLPVPALPQVPDQRSRPVARWTQPGTAAGELRSCRLYDPPRLVVAGSAKQKGRLRPLVSRQRRDLDGDRRRSPASRRRDRLLGVLHTWGQTLQAHPHIHYVIPSGGLSADHQSWVHPRYPFFLPVRVLSRVFRGKFVDGLKHAFQNGKLLFPGSLKPLGEAKAFHAFLRPLFRKDWVVYSKRPFGGPEHVLHYLARYTHRVAISNHRIVNLADGNVTFQWKDYAHKSKRRLMTVTAHEFLRRFLLHTLPRGFVRIRFCGFLANRRRRELLPLCRRCWKAAG